MVQGGSPSPSCFSSQLNTLGVSANGLGESSPHDPILNGILSWDTYDEFMAFCSKIGIVVDDTRDAKCLLNLIKAQYNLPASDLDEENACVDLLHALHC